MPTIQHEQQKLNPDALVILYELRAPAGVPVVAQFFTASGNGMPVTFNGQAYQPWALQAEGFESSSTGSAPRPTLTISNIVTTDAGQQVQGVFSALARQYRGLSGWALIRRVTHAKFCAGGSAAASPELYPEEVWKINRRLSSDNKQISFELVSSLEFIGNKAPGILATRYCPPFVAYRGPECEYAGVAMFDINDRPTSDPAQDVCGKRLSSCRCRGNAGNFGGFPGMRRYD